MQFSTEFLQCAMDRYSYFIAFSFVISAISSYAYPEKYLSMINSFLRLAESIASFIISFSIRLERFCLCYWRF